MPSILPRPGNTSAPKNRFDVLYEAQNRQTRDNYYREAETANRELQNDISWLDAQTNAQIKYAKALAPPKKSSCKSFLGFGCGNEGFTDFYGPTVQSAVGGLLGNPVPTVPRQSQVPYGGTPPFNPNAGGGYSTGGTDVVTAVVKFVEGLFKAKPKTSSANPMQSYNDAFSSQDWESQYLPDISESGYYPGSDR
jgi:hypothetical protein